MSGESKSAYVVRWCMVINGGIVWTIVVFIGRLALYTQVDASQGMPVFNKSDNILAAC